MFSRAKLKLPDPRISFAACRIAPNAQAVSFDSREIRLTPAPPSSATVNPGCANTLTGRRTAEQIARIAGRLDDAMIHEGPEDGDLLVGHTRIAAGTLQPEPVGSAGSVPGVVELEAEPACESTHGRVPGIDELAAVLGDLSVGPAA